MNPKYRPRPITSFMEDEFELDVFKKGITKPAPEGAWRRQHTIMAVRIIIAIAAVVVALWLYILVDEFTTAMFNGL